MLFLQAFGGFSFSLDFGKVVPQNHVTTPKGGNKVRYIFNSLIFTEMSQVLRPMLGNIEKI